MFNPMKFVENLYYMGIGMLSIFIVIGIVVLGTYLLNFIFKDKPQNTDSDKKE